MLLYHYLNPTIHIVFAGLLIVAGFSSGYIFHTLTVDLIKSMNQMEKVKKIEYNKRMNQLENAINRELQVPGAKEKVASYIKQHHPEVQYPFQFPKTIDV